MNGDIGVTSEEGKGSTFWFTAVFKIGEKSDEKDESKNIQDEGLSTKRKLKILLAEDNKINQRVAIVNLKNLGHKVDLANNGKEAVELFKKNLYDIVLMDIMMPIMDGIESTRLIREIQDNQAIKKGIPIVAMTANALKGDREKLLAQGMNSYISKPFSRDQLKVVLLNPFGLH